MIEATAVPVDDFNSPTTDGENSVAREEDILDTNPLIEQKRAKHQADYERRLRNYLIGLYGAGGITVLLSSPPAFGAAWVVLDVYNFNMALAVLISLIVVLDRVGLIGFFQFPQLKSFAEYLANKHREPLTRKEIFTELGLYLAGIPSALFFAIFNFAMLAAFNVTVQKYKDTISPVFIALAAVATTLAAGLVTAIPAFIVNLVGTPNIFRTADKLFFELMDDWRSFFSYTTRRKVRFGIENSMFVGILAVTIWGLSAYFGAAQSAYETYLHCPSELAFAFAIYQMVFMSVIAFICSTLVGKKLGGFIFEIGARDFAGWPTRSQVGINVAIGTAAALLGTTASVQVVFAAILDGLGAPQQFSSGFASTILEFMPLFGIGKLVEAGVRAGLSATENCRKAWWGSTKAFFKKNCCCGGDNRGKPVKLDVMSEQHMGATL